jgi:hypothetical protein
VLKSVVAKLADDIETLQDEEKGQQRREEKEGREKTHFARRNVPVATLLDLSEDPRLRVR